MNDIKANTYTNHPAYQEPLIRSKLHNQIRYFLGVLVFILISAPLVISGVIGIFYGIYEVGISFYTLDIFNQVFLFKLLSPIISYVIILVGIEFFFWARHLTRAMSREFV